MIHVSCFIRPMPYLIVGLGNPGREYAATRHNLGFILADALAKKTDAVPVSVKILAEARRGEIGGKAAYIIKPQTFMNLSGDAVSAFMRAKRIVPAELVAIHDDIDLPFGEIRVSKGASAGGHNGVKSLIERIGTKDFVRLRIGVGRPPEGTPADAHVLGKFSPEEKKELPAIIAKALEELDNIFTRFQK